MKRVFLFTTFICVLYSLGNSSCFVRRNAYGIYDRNDTSYRGPDTSKAEFIFYVYGLHSDYPDKVLDPVHAKWGVMLHSVAQCRVDEALRERTKVRNAAVRERFVAKYGSNWYISFNKDMEDEEKRQRVKKSRSTYIVKDNGDGFPW